ncbi:MAG: hypothetical protein ACXWC7_20150, partial [Chitinophagaceae bacterium]
MKPIYTIAILFLAVSPPLLHAQDKGVWVNLFGTATAIPVAPKPMDYKEVLSQESVTSFIETINEKELKVFLDVLENYKQQQKPDDWLYYQAVRKIAQHLSPKAENYHRYTFYKWWLLTKSGYNAILTFSGNYLLFYVQSDENIYNIPYRIKDKKQYVCLNYHDYGTIDFEKNKFQEVRLVLPENLTAFSYKVTRLPEFATADYTDKEVQFNYGLDQYRFNIKLNPQVKSIFTNYPVVDYSLQFNTPLSDATYQSLIPSLQKHIKSMKQKDGVEFLMNFTRYAFLFKPDGEVFGSEKRMSPEQTLLYEYSDCEDRAALFFYLVKEIYNLPMLVLTYPNHVMVAVQFDKPYGKTIEYNGMKYSVCEPTPQKFDLRIGQLSPEFKKQAYEIAYV